MCERALRHSRPTPNRPSGHACRDAHTLPNADGRLLLRGDARRASVGRDANHLGGCDRYLRDSRMLVGLLLALAVDLDLVTHAHAIARAEAEEHVIVERREHRGTMNRTD